MNWCLLPWGLFVSFCRFDFMFIMKCTLMHPIYIDCKFPQSQKIWKVVWRSYLAKSATPLQLISSPNTKMMKIFSCWGLVINVLLLNLFHVACWLDIDSCLVVFKPIGGSIHLFSLEIILAACITAKNHLFGSMARVISFGGLWPLWRITSFCFLSWTLKINF